MMQLLISSKVLTTMDQKFEFFSDDYVFEDEQSGSDETRELIVRLDKWLWAARFFKTRAVARLAVEKGKVFYNGERAKPSREIELGATIYIQQGRFEKTVVVRGLSTRRRGTEESLQLFEETEESRLNREEGPTEPDYTHFQSPYQPRGFYPPTQPEQVEQPRERRVIRFLRRSFNRGESRPPQTKTSRPTHPNSNVEIFD